MSCTVMSLCVCGNGFHVTVTTPSSPASRAHATNCTAIPCTPLIVFNYRPLISCILADFTVTLLINIIILTKCVAYKFGLTGYNFVNFFVGSI